MSESACSVKIYTKEKTIICLITVDVSDTVLDIKEKIIVTKMKDIVMYRNKH